MADFSKYDTFVFDLDGTVWDVTKLLPGVSKTFSILKKKGKNVIFVSNHTMYSRRQIAHRLERMGLEVEESDIINAGFSVAKWLRAHHASKAMIFGEGIVRDLREEGIANTKELPVGYVVIGHDRKMNYEKLARIYRASRAGASILTSAVGRLFYYKGKWYPGMGVVNSAVEAMTGKKPVELGKPSSWMLKLVMKRVKGRTVIFGDEVNSDIPFGKKAGWTTVLIKTEVNKLKKGDIRPDFVLRSVADIKV